MQVYLDNAASTALDPLVLEEMLPWMQTHQGNPSSIHGYGRKAKVAIENARKEIAKNLGCSPAEIFFTSGGTESDNTAIFQSINTLGVKHIVTSPLEHHAVLHSIEAAEKFHSIHVHYVNIDSKGNIDLAHLDTLLSALESPTLVSLMHGNNEIGNLTDIEKVGQICQKHQAFFHSDTVQTVGHFPINLKNTSIHFITGSAHKFHGPKGVGFLYVNADAMIDPMIYGGGQERNMRGGTENLYGIVGMAKAFQLSITNLEERKKHIIHLKKRMIGRLKELIPGIQFNGTSESIEHSLYTVINVSLPPSDDYEMFLFSLDIHGIAASAGSACASGTSIGSHVLRAIKAEEDRGHLRFSFSHLNTIEEIDYAAEKLAKEYGIWNKK